VPPCNGLLSDYTFTHMNMTSGVSLGGLAGCTGAQAYPGPGVYPYAIPSPDMPSPIPPTQGSRQGVKGFKQVLHLSCCSSAQGMMLYDGPYVKDLKALSHEQNSLHSDSQSHFATAFC